MDPLHAGLCHQERVKAAPKYSVITNLCLAVCLTWALIKLRNSALTAPAPRLAENEQNSTSALEPVSAKFLPLEFRWSQIESSDYRIYIANLRRVGCPERTVRDIIKADVESLYTARRRELHLVENDAGPWSRREATQLVDLLLGTAATGVQLAEKPTNSNAVAKVRLPLVLQTVDAMSLELAPEQRQAIERLREEFVARVGGSERDPSDPAYRELWQKAQPEIDEALAGTIGLKAYLELESAAWTGDEPAE